jgi:hypothetical protein
MHLRGRGFVFQEEEKNLLLPLSKSQLLCLTYDFSRAHTFSHTGLCLPAILKAGVWAAGSLDKPASSWQGKGSYSLYSIASHSCDSRDPTSPHYPRIKTPYCSIKVAVTL